MATSTEVDLAFRFLLGRAPTDAERNDWAVVPADALRAKLMATDDFRSALPGDAVLMPLNLPVPESVWSVDAATTQALLDRVQRRWIQLGETAPHWSTDMRAEFMPDRIAENMPVFEASGSGDVATLVSVLARYGFTPEQLPRVCDFGCGVGRMTLPLSRVFHYVTGCDVSTPHLSLARAATGARVNYALVSVPEFGMHGPFDFWFSTLTLQHNPPPVIALILQRMFSMLAPGGVAIFQLPTERIGYRFNPAEYLAAPDTGELMEIHVLPQAVVFALAKEAGCVPLEVREDGLIWPVTSVLSNRFIFTKPRAPATSPQPLARR